MGEGVLDHLNVGLGRWGNNILIFMCGSVLACWGTGIYSFLNLSDIEIAQYFHLNEPISEVIGTSYCLNHQVSNERPFVGVSLNEPLFENVDHVPPVDVLSDNMNFIFGNISPALPRLYNDIYNDGKSERRPQEMTLKPPNASQLYLISHFLLWNEIFNPYTPIRQSITPHIGPRRTCKTRTIMSLVAATYNLVEKLDRYSLPVEQLIKRRINRRRCKLVVNLLEHFHLSDSISRLQMLKGLCSYRQRGWFPGAHA